MSAHQILEEKLPLTADSDTRDKRHLTTYDILQRVARKIES